MLSLDDPRWKHLQGGDRVPYDASVALARLARGEDVWDELWQELHPPHRNSALPEPPAVRRRPA